MVSFSKITQGINWFFNQSNNKNPKYLSHKHALFSFIFAFITSIKSMSYINKKIIGNKQQIIPAWCKIKGSSFLLIYLFVMLFGRYIQNGHTALYQFVWACNIAIVLAAYGMYNNKPSIIFASLLTVSLDQILWLQLIIRYIDLIGYLLKKKFIIGVAAYITWPQTSKLRILTSFHHVWFIPMMLISMRKVKLDSKIYLITMIFSIILSLLGRLLAPRYIQKPDVFYCNKGTSLYMNINCGWQMWKDIKIKGFHYFNDKPSYIGVPVLCLHWVVFNSIGYFLIKQLHNSLIYSQKC